MSARRGSLPVGNGAAVAGGAGATLQLGWFVKQGSQLRTWKRRWAVVNSGWLLYFTSQRCSVLKGAVPLVGSALNTRLIVRGGKRLQGFELYHAPSSRKLLGIPEAAAVKGGG